MAIIKNPNKRNKATNPLIQEFEKSIKGILPNDYRQFLLQHNGGDPEPDFITLKEKDGEEFETNVYFFRLDSEQPYQGDSLQANYDENLESIPANLIPIGQDYSGNIISLSINMADFGSVYFCHHDYFPNNGEESTDDGILFISGSFADLFSMLREES